MIVVTAKQNDTLMSANEVALANNIPTAALVELNSISWQAVSPGNYCVPESCQIAVINETISASMYVAANDELSEAQFWDWNEYMDAKNLIVGEIVCVG